MTVNSTASERSIAASLAAYSLHAQRDSRELTVKAREAFFGKFVDEVDPDRTLPEDERLRRAEAARKAHMKRMALKSVQARRRNKQTRSTTATASPATHLADGAIGGAESSEVATASTGVMATTTKRRSTAGRSTAAASPPTSTAETARASKARAAS